MAQDLFNPKTLKLVQKRRAVLCFRRYACENKLIDYALVDDLSGPVMVLIKEHNIFRGFALKHYHDIVVCAYSITITQVVPDLPEVIFKFPFAEIVFTKFQSSRYDVSFPVVKQFKISL